MLCAQCKVHNSSSLLVYLLFFFNESVINKSRYRLIKKRFLCCVSLRSLLKWPFLCFALCRWFFSSGLNGSNFTFCPFSCSRPSVALWNITGKPLYKPSRSTHPMYWSHMNCDKSYQAFVFFWLSKMWINYIFYSPALRNVQNLQTIQAFQGRQKGVFSPLVVNHLYFVGV